MFIVAIGLRQWCVLSLLQLRLYLIEKKCSGRAVSTNLQCILHLQPASAGELGPAWFTLSTFVRSNWQDNEKLEITLRVNVYFEILVLLNIMSLILKLRWYHALSSIKTHHKIVSAIQEKVALLGRTIAEQKIGFNKTQIAIALHTATVHKSQVHNFRNKNITTVTTQLHLKNVLIVFTAYLSLCRFVSNLG